MSDQDHADVFLRHRSAVLDTLLSDPELSVRSVATPPVDSGAGRVDPPEFDPVAAQQDSVGATAAPPRPPSATRASGGARASDRIMALLNGQSPDAGGGGLEFTADYAERSRSRLDSAQKADPPPEAPPAEGKPSDRGGAGAGNIGQTLLVTVRKPKVAIGLAAALAVVIILALITTSGGRKDQGNTRVVTAVAAAPSSPVAPSSPEHAVGGSVIAVKAATSHCPAGSTPGMDAFSGQADKAWSCVRAYKVDGQVLTIDLGKKYQIDSIGIVPGWDSVGADGSDLWTKYRTVSRVRYQFDDANATAYTQQTLDQRSLVVTKISPPVTASKITLSVLESKGDSSINTTAISSIVITGQ